MPAVSLAPLPRYKRLEEFPGRWWTNRCTRQADPSAPIEPIKVFPQVCVNNITATDVVNQTFDMEFYLSLTWEDEQFVKQIATEEWNQQMHGDWQQMMRETCWHPALVLKNCVELRQVNEKGYPEFWFKVDGNMISFRCNIVGTFFERYELEKFPFDMQPLTVKMHATFEAHHVRFAPITVEDIRKQNGSCREQKLPINGGPLRHDRILFDGFILEEWRLQPLIFTRAAVSSPNSSASGKVYPTLAIECELRRNWNYHFWNMLIFLFAICSLSFTVILVPPDEFADRSSITLCAPPSALLSEGRTAFVAGDERSSAASTRPECCPAITKGLPHNDSPLECRTQNAPTHRSRVQVRGG